MKLFLIKTIYYENILLLKGAYELKYLCGIAYTVGGLFLVKVL